MSGMQQFDPQMMQQILQMMNQQKQDPFSRTMPGEGLLGSGGMATPNQGGMVQSAPHDNNMGGQPQEQKNQVDTISTSFNSTPPGLPNLPDSFGGFGYGQFAPKEFSPPGLRQQYIQQMLKMMPHMGGGGMMSPSPSMGSPGQSLSPMPGGAMGQIPRMPPRMGGFGGGM